MKQRKFSEEFKAKVAIEAIKGQRTANELAQEFGVHVNQINLWEKKLLKSALEVFSTTRTAQLNIWRHSGTFCIAKLGSCRSRWTG